PPSFPTRRSSDLTARAPIARVAWPSVFVDQLRPPSGLRQTPPSDAPAYTVEPLAAIAVTRPALGEKVLSPLIGCGPRRVQVPPSGVTAARGARARWTRPPAACRAC